MSLRVNKSTAKLAFKGIGRQVEKMKLGFGMIEQTKDDNLDLLVTKYLQVYTCSYFFNFNNCLSYIFIPSNQGGVAAQNTPT